MFIAVSSAGRTLFFSVTEIEFFFRKKLISRTIVCRLSICRLKYHGSFLHCNQFSLAQMSLIHPVVLKLLYFNIATLWNGAFRLLTVAANLTITMSAKNVWFLRYDSSKYIDLKLQKQI